MGWKSHFLSFSLFLGLVFALVGCSRSSENMAANASKKKALNSVTAEAVHEPLEIRPLPSASEFPDEFIELSPVEDLWDKGTWDEAKWR